MSDGMGREPAYLSSHATNRYFIPNWGKYSTKNSKSYASQWVFSLKKRENSTYYGRTSKATCNSTDKSTYNCSNSRANKSS